VIRITVSAGRDLESVTMPVGPGPREQITVYGTTWCRDCHLAKAVLKFHEVDYAWVDIDQEPSAVEFLLRLNRGRRTVPTIVFPDGRVLVEPTRRELEAALAPPPAA
jgi:mycoredoxin